MRCLINPSSPRFFPDNTDTMTTTRDTTNLAPLKKSFSQSIRSVVRRTFQTKPPSQEQDDIATITESTYNMDSGWECRTLIEVSPDLVHSNWPAQRALSPERFDPSSAAWTALMLHSCPSEPADEQSTHFQGEMMDFDDCAWGPPRRTKYRSRADKRKPESTKSRLTSRSSVQSKRDTQSQMLAQDDQSWM